MAKNPKTIVNIKNAIIFLTFHVLMINCTSNSKNDSESNSQYVDQEIKTVLNESDSLKHLVFLNLKNDINDHDKESLEAAIKKLKQISEVVDLKLGDFYNLGDQRALKDYEWLLEMKFRNKEDYQIYQSHPHHLELKKIAAPLLESAPASYDYWLR